MCVSQEPCAFVPHCAQLDISVCPIGDGVCQDKPVQAQQTWRSFDNILLASACALISWLHFTLPHCRRQGGRHKANTMIVSHNKYKYMPCWLLVALVGRIYRSDAVRCKRCTWQRLVTSATPIYEWHFTVQHSWTGLTGIKFCLQDNVLSFGLCRVCYSTLLCHSMKHFCSHIMGLI